MSCESWNIDIKFSLILSVITLEANVEDVSVGVLKLTSVRITLYGISFYVHLLV